MRELLESLMAMVFPGENGEAKFSTFEVITFYGLLFAFGLFLYLMAP